MAGPKLRDFLAALGQGVSQYSGYMAQNEMQNKQAEQQSAAQSAAAEAALQRMREEYNLRGMADDKRMSFEEQLARMGYGHDERMLGLGHTYDLSKIAAQGDQTRLTNEQAFGYDRTLLGDRYDREAGMIPLRGDQDVRVQMERDKGAMARLQAELTGGGRGGGADAGPTIQVNYDVNRDGVIDGKDTMAARWVAALGGRPLGSDETVGGNKMVSDYIYSQLYDQKGRVARPVKDFSKMHGIDERTAATFLEQRFYEIMDSGAPSTAAAWMQVLKETGIGGKNLGNIPQYGSGGAQQNSSVPVGF